MSNLVAFYNEVTGLVGVVRVDFSKAFDMVSLILDKLTMYGLGKWTVKWTENWLKDWDQSVVNSGTKSSCRHVASGVPQGFTLRPILLTP